MPMYYFDLCDGQTLSDDDGTSLANTAAARSHAFGVVRELMFRSDGMLGHNWARWTMSVRDSGGSELFSFKLSDYDQ